MPLYRRFAVCYIKYATHSCCGPPRPASGVSTSLRTNGVSTNGAAAKVMNFDGLGKKVSPGTFRSDLKCAVTRVVLTPAVPFRSTLQGQAAWR